MNAGFEAMNTPRIGMVLAAGLGTRLRPLTDSLPKPLVQLAGKPLLEHALDAMLTWGVEHVYVNSHHVGEKLQAWHASYRHRRLVSLVEEPTLLGTGGGIRNALLENLEPGEHAVVSNGDILYRPDVRRHFALHRAQGFLASLVIRPDPNQQRYGVIGADDTHRLVRLLDAGDQDAVHTGMFSGVHFLSREAISTLPEQGCVVRRGYQRWFEQGSKLGAFTDKTPWHDAGEYQLFVELEKRFADGRLHWPPSGD